MGYYANRAVIELIFKVKEKIKECKESKKVSSKDKDNKKSKRSN